jgi:DNA-binding MarR family transcriptional regulator
MSLTRTELRSWLLLIGGVQSLLDALDRQLRDEAGISHDDYRILSSLYRSSAHTRRMSELAREMNYSPSRLTHAAARLERQGWVSRSPAGGDRRGVDIELTDAGEVKARDASEGHLALVKKLVFDVPEPDQLHAAVEALDQIGKVADGSS